MLTGDLSKWTSEQWQVFWAGAKGSEITSLDLSGNSLQYEPPFCDGLAQSGITNLTISSNGLGTERLQKVQSILQQNVRKMGLGEGDLQQFCLHTLWQQPNASLKNGVFTSDKTEALSLGDGGFLEEIEKKHKPINVGVGSPAISMIGLKRI